MNRREFAAALSLAGTGVLAGCVGDGDGTADENGEETTDENGEGTTDENGEGTTEEGTPGSDGGDDATQQSENGPRAVVEAFFESYGGGDADQINRFLHSESDIEPLSQDEADRLNQTEFTVESLEVVSRDDQDARVAVSFSADSPDWMQTLVAIELAPDGDTWRVMGFVTEDQQQAVHPSVNFEFDANRAENSVRITHASGESVSADQLTVRGQGLAERGTWNALGGETDEDGLVAAGYSVTVPVEEPAVELELVWGDQPGETTAVLADATVRVEPVDPDAPEAVEEYLSDARGYDGVVDLTEEDEPTIAVGAGDEGFGFSPAAVRVSPGTTVVWKWSGEDGAHSVTHEDGEFESELVTEDGHRFEHTFEESGTYLYHCLPHKSLGMKGAIVVE